MSQCVPPNPPNIQSLSSITQWLKALVQAGRPPGISKIMHTDTEETAGKMQVSYLIGIILFTQSTQYAKTYDSFAT